MKRGWNNHSVRRRNQKAVDRKIGFRPIRNMKEKLIEFLFSKGGVFITRLLTTGGVSLASYFEMSDQEQQGLIAAIAALVGFILIGIKGKVKERFVKEYQKKKHLVVDGAPLKDTTASLDSVN